MASQQSLARIETRLNTIAQDFKASHAKIHDHPVMSQTKGEIAAFKASHIAIVVACVCLAGLCGFLVWAVHPLRATIKDLHAKVDTLTAHAEATLDKADALAATVAAIAATVTEVNNKVDAI